MKTTDIRGQETLSDHVRADALSRLSVPSEPSFSCNHCPRLRDFIDEQKTNHPGWWNGPVPTWHDMGAGDEAVELLIVGLAPGLTGANRTSRAFTGDSAGDLLYATLQKHGFATGQYGSGPDDGLKLVGTAITNAVRCVPPQNKPVGAEINACRDYLIDSIARFSNLKVLLTLGAIGHQSTIRALGHPVKDAPFGHNFLFAQPFGPAVLSSYHCSRYNTNTGVLTEDMFSAVFARARLLIDAKR
ncbi:MAG: uracil-DNA glycosylase [Pseudomonadota bacterium]